MKRIGWLVLALWVAHASWAALNLLERYPTSLTGADSSRGRDWTFTGEDIFALTEFKLEMGDQLRLDLGPSNLGIGHDKDGALWAVVVPQTRSTLQCQATNVLEPVAHVWLRFHPSKLNELFPPANVSGPGAKALALEMGVIARAKMGGSSQMNGRPIIPAPEILIADVDAWTDVRRVFLIDKNSGTARYVSAFEKRFVRRPPPTEPKVAEEAFDAVWKAFDENYAMFGIRPEVNWQALRAEFRPKALASKSAYEFAEHLAQMLRPLRDLHVWLTLAGSNVPVFDRPRPVNSNPAAIRAAFPSLKPAGRDVQWAVTPEHIGYIYIRSWSDNQTPAHFNQILEGMRSTRALIIDVRLNGGGSEPLARDVAARFIDGTYTYGFSQIRNGPMHTDLSAKRPRVVTARGPWRYDRPVLLLIGQRCMSSSESFVAMMAGGPQVTTIGDRTAGSSGNPQIINLPLAMTVSVPQWIDYFPDGSILDERGIEPKIQFAAQPGAFDGDRDDLLASAIERAGKSPLPAEPISGAVFVPADRAKLLQEQAADGARPQVVAVSPADGSTTPATTEIRVRFDRPMNPLGLSLQWAAGGFITNELPAYDDEKFEFTIPVRLVPNAFHQIVINETGGPLEGFLSTNNIRGAMFLWNFRATAADPVQERARGSANIALDELLATMQKARADLTAFVEHVQTVERRGDESGALRVLKSTGSELRWQAPNCVFADVSAMMGSVMTFRIGCDGTNWWWHLEHPQTNILAICPAQEMGEANVSLADPFGLTRRSPAQAIEELGLRHGGMDGKLHVVKNATHEWRIDASTFLPHSVSASDGAHTMRFHFTNLNASHPPALFNPPPVKASPLTPLSEEHPTRFVNLRDGADGRMTVRWGEKGPGGRSSSGLN